MKRVLVTSYVNPDLDGVACSVAYAELLKKTGTDAVAGAIGTPHQEAAYMLNRFSVTHLTTIANADAFDEVILVDASDVNDLEGMIAPEKVVEIIDHRAVHNASEFPNAVAQIEPVGAAATLIAEKFLRQQVEISKESAALLFGGIISNTLNFQGSMTTSRDRNIAAWLNGIARLPEDFWRELFMAKSDVRGEKLAHTIEDDVAWFVFGGTRVGIAELEMIGAQTVLDERTDEIVRLLERMKSTMHLDRIFLNVTELEDVATYLVATDDATKQLLSAVFGASFVGAVARLPHAMMRKQMTPLLKKALA